MLNAGVDDFVRSSGRYDILHFSMHAELNAEDPLESFLAFQPKGKDDGRMTVNDILKVRLKPRSLAFLASCDTTKVLSGEGSVSLAWAMLGSGSTSVVSAQWEANDKATAAFAENFYRSYLDKASVARAMQSAAVSMIRTKSAGSNEPYYWAAFSLMGDHR